MSAISLVAMRAVLAPFGLAYEVGLPWVWLPMFGDQAAARVVGSNPSRLSPTHLFRRYAVPVRKFTLVIPRCCYCARAGISLFQFALLAEAARKFNVRLKLPRSNWFHEPCSRKAYKALIKKPCVAFLQGGIR